MSATVFLIQHRFSVKCGSYLFFGDTKAKIEKEKFQYLKTVKIKISRGRKSQLVISCQVVCNACCILVVIFCGFIWHLIGRETINIPEIFSGVYTPNANMADRSVVARHESHESEASQSSMFCCDNVSP